MNEDKTTTRETKSGIVTKIISLATFPEEMHQKVKDRSHRTFTVTQIYSEAVLSMKRQHDSGATIALVSVPKDGYKTQFWMLEEARDAMDALCTALKDDPPTIVYNALLRYFEDEL